jgi:hypothetical protein
MELWESKVGDHIAVHMQNTMTCLSCGGTIAAGSYAVETTDYVMTENNKGEEVVGRRFRFINSPCLCPTTYITDMNDALTQHAENMRQAQIIFWQEAVYDAEKYPFPINLDLMQANQSQLAFIKRCSLATIMNIISGFSEEPTP